MSEEKIASLIMMPTMLQYAYAILETEEIAEDTAEDTLQVCSNYQEDLDGFVNSDYRTPAFYYSFRQFLAERDFLFQEEYALLEKITDEQIDFAIKRIQEERDIHTRELTADLEKSLQQN